MTRSVLRFRYSAALLAATVLAFIGTVPVAAQSWYLAPLLLVPVVAAWWVLRTGTDAGPDGLRVRALLGSRLVPWPAVARLVPDGRGTRVELTDGRSLPLPAVRPADLPRLVSAAGGELDTPRPATDTDDTRGTGGTGQEPSAAPREPSATAQEPTAAAQ